MKKRGRPTKLTNAIIQKLPDLIRMGLTDSQMADVLQIAQPTITLWKKTNRDFMITYLVEKEKQNFEVEKSLLKRAIGYDKTVGGRERHYPGDVDAQKFWLTNRRPETWQYTQEDLQHEGSITINLTVPRPGSTEQKIIDAVTTAVPRPMLKQ